MENQIAVVPAAAHSPVSSWLDPSGLGPIPNIPLVPEKILRKHWAFVSNDTRFRSAARLLQTLWRQDRDLPMGTFFDQDGARHRLGSSISKQAGREGANFLTPAIAQVVHRELIYREYGAMIDTDRLRTNLLSSMPLTFNLFALLKRDLTLATKFMAELLPGMFRSVEAILFEHSPGRGKTAFTGDHSAFDVLIRGTTLQGLRGFVAIEVKYSESMLETQPLRLSDRLLEIALGAELCDDVNLSGLWRNPHQQLAREHLLAQSMLDRGLADVGLFVLVAPAANHLVQQAATSYAAYLNGPRQGRAHFVNLTLERLVECYAAVKHETYARMLHRRYLDWWQIDGELALDDPPDPTDQPNAATVDLKAAA